MCKTSEFGKGLTYCLGLFLAHQDKFRDKEKAIYSATNNLMGELWFNAASDHLYELQIPDNYSKYLKDRLSRFQNKVLSLGHGSPEQVATESDIQWSLNEAKLLLIEIDKHIGVKTIKGEWE